MTLHSSALPLMHSHLVCAGHVRICLRGRLALSSCHRGVLFPTVAENDDLVGNVGGGEFRKRKGSRGLGDPGSELHGGGRDRQAGEPRRRFPVQLQHLHRRLRGTRT